jgi:hypothetical protein
MHKGSFSNTRFDNHELTYWLHTSYKVLKNFFLKLCFSSRFSVIKFFSLLRLTLYLNDNQVGY